MNNWPRSEASRAIFQARALSSDIPARRKGIYLLYNPPINFSTRTHLDRKLVGLLDFIYTEIGAKVDRLSCQVCSLQGPKRSKVRRRKLKHDFFLNVFATVLFEKITADKLTILHKNA